MQPVILEIEAIAESPVNFQDLGVDFSRADVSNHFFF
jgi:hypothetical protein